MKYLKLDKSVPTSILFLLAFSLSRNVLATDINLICQGGGDCEMYPAPNTKLFDYSGLLPGDSVTNTLTIENTNDYNACDMTMKISKVSEDPSNFADNLWVVIKESAVDFFGARDGPNMATNYKNIEDLYALQTIDLGPLAANSSRVFDWTATFNPLSGNDLQNALTKFDLKFNVACKISKKEGDRCIKFSKHHHKDYGGDKDNHRDDEHNDDNRWFKGDHIKYTMEIRSDSKRYRDVKVTDTPFHGSKYIKGSWTAFSNKHGNMKKTGRMHEPHYGSPGVWEIGDLEPGEVVTLTYETEITDDDYTGNEGDEAWVSATDPDDASLTFSNDANSNLLVSSLNENTTQTAQSQVNSTDSTNVIPAKSWSFFRTLWNQIRHWVQKIR